MFSGRKICLKNIKVSKDRAFLFLLWLLFLLQMEGFARCLDTHTHQHTHIYISPGFINPPPHLYIFTIFTYYIHACTYIHTFIFTCIYMSNLSTNSHILIFIHTFFHTCITYIYLHIFAYTHIYIYIFRQYNFGWLDNGQISPHVYFERMRLLTQYTWSWVEGCVRFV